MSDPVTGFDAELERVFGLIPEELQTVIADHRCRQFDWPTVSLTLF